MTVEFGNTKVGPEGDHGSPEAERKGAHPDHGEDLGVAGYMETERLVQMGAAGGMKIAGVLRGRKIPVVHSNHLGSGYNHLAHVVQSQSAVRIAFRSCFQGFVPACLWGIFGALQVHKLDLGREVPAGSLGQGPAAGNRGFLHHSAALESFPPDPWSQEAGFC